MLGVVAARKASVARSQSKSETERNTGAWVTARAGCEGEIESWTQEWTIEAAQVTGRMKLETGRKEQK